MNNLFKVIYLFCFVFLSASCEEENCPTQPPPTSDPTLAGEWVGSDTSHSLVVYALFTQTGNEVGGTGDIQGYSNGACTFSGTNIYPNVLLVVSRAGELDIGYTGEFKDNSTIEGLWKVSNGAEHPMTFVKQ